MTIRSLCLKGRKRHDMRVIISEKLRNHLLRIGSAVLTITLEPLRC